MPDFQVCEQIAPYNDRLLLRYRERPNRNKRLGAVRVVRPAARNFYSVGMLLQLEQHENML